MTFPKLVSNPAARKIVLVLSAFALAACAGDVDNTIGSRLEQPPKGSKPEAPIEAGDIAIAGQDFSHAIRQLPEVADAKVPPLVRFTGVTSIVDGPVDTEPYTVLLRDRLLLGDREKLRFVERQLPPLNVHKKIHKNSDVTPTVTISSEDPDYQVLAELRGKVDADFYRIQIEFVEFHTGHVLFNGVYRIRKESGGSGSGGGEMDNGQQAAAPPSSDAPVESTAPRDSDDDENAPPPPREQYGSGAGPVFHE